MINHVPFPKRVGASADGTQNRIQRMFPFQMAIKFSGGEKKFRTIVEKTLFEGGRIHGTGLHLRRMRFLAARLIVSLGARRRSLLLHRSIITTKMQTLIVMVQHLDSVFCSKVASFASTLKQAFSVLIIKMSRQMFTTGKIFFRGSSCPHSFLSYFWFHPSQRNSC